VWLIAVVGLNWPFGKPDFDFNYEPSGNLAGAISVNRRAFAVAHDIARTIAEREETAKAILGHPERGVSAIRTRCSRPPAGSTCGGSGVLLLVLRHSTPLFPTQNTRQDGARR
jgi:hypothetical protein